MAGTEPVYLAECKKQLRIAGLAVGGVGSVVTGNPLPLAGGLAVGSVLGSVMCKEGGLLDDFYKSQYDFEGTIDRLRNSLDARQASAQSLSANPLVGDPETANLLISHALDVARDNPAAAYAATRAQSMNVNNPGAVAELATLGNLARQTIANTKSVA